MCRNPPPKVNRSVDSQLLSLLQACKDDLESDAQRLILADWLDDHGDEDRARFVRWQCGVGDDVELDRVINASQLKQWQGDTRGNWLRGLFVWEAQPSNLRTFLTSPRQKHIRPWTCGVRLARVKRAALAGLPSVLADFARLELPRLEIGGYLRGDGVRVLADAPHLTDLVSLSFGTGTFHHHANRIDRGGYDANRIGLDGLHALNESRCLTRLTSLDLANNGLDAEGVHILAQRAQPVKLVSLVLRDNKIGDEGVRALAESPAMSDLVSLDLRFTDIGPEGVKALINSPYLTSLIFLDLSSNDITGEGAMALVESTRLAKLSCLVLWGSVPFEEEVEEKVYERLLCERFGAVYRWANG